MEKMDIHNGYPFGYPVWISKIQIRGTYAWKLSIGRGFVWICLDMSRYPYISAWSKFPDGSTCRTCRSWRSGCCRCCTLTPPAASAHSQRVYEYSLTPPVLAPSLTPRLLPARPLQSTGNSALFAEKLDSWQHPPARVAESKRIQVMPW